MDMNTILANLLGTAVSLAGGAATKAISKSRNRMFHEYGAPLAAAAIGAGYAALTGHTLDPQTLITGGVQFGGQATLLHSVYYGAKPRNRKVKQ